MSEGTTTYISTTPYRRRRPSAASATALKDTDYLSAIIMNSYPLDLLTQLAPVMFVAGLDQPTSQSSSKPDEFLILITRLREALQSQRKVAVWQSEKTKTFQIILVDKDVRFPPRKLVPPDDPQYSSVHSPLSPLTPTSPLHPDGLIAPIWIRKHTNLVPSVFVLFLRIYEHPTHGGRSPLEGLDNNREREKEQEERKHDTELASEVALRKKSTNERGIKLTVVLMSSRKMLGKVIVAQFCFSTNLHVF